MVIVSGMFEDARANREPVGSLASIISRRLRPIPCLTVTLVYQGSKQYISVGTGAPNTFQITLTNSRAFDRIFALMKAVFYNGPATRVHMQPTNSHCVLNLKKGYTVNIPALREYVSAHTEDGVHLNTCPRARRPCANIIYLAMTQMGEPDCLVAVVVSRHSVKVIGAKSPRLYIHFIRTYLCQTGTICETSGAACADHRACFLPFEGYEYHFLIPRLRDHIRKNRPAQAQMNMARTRGRRSRMLVNEAILRAYGSRPVGNFVSDV